MLCDSWQTVRDRIKSIVFHYEVAYGFRLVEWDLEPLNGGRAAISAVAELVLNNIRGGSSYTSG